MQIRMKQVVLKDGSSCPWDGPSSITLTEKNGTLTFDTELRGVLAVHGVRDPMLIPLESVRYMVEHGAAAQKAEENKAVEAAELAKAEARRKAVLKAAHDPDAPKGVEKFVKNPTTGAVESQKV